ncbi:MAG: phosphoribosylanthranilate isomerase [Methylobacteriaceae bacterium]|nr:phosphoribosylanthranilate isomerase [Methylobacteriaceae bacterium]
MAFIVKICGLSTPETLDAALSAGADMVGFVFVAKSPRHVTLDVARALARRVAAPVRKVALVVDADDALLAAVVEALAPDVLQLHGQEAPGRVSEIRRAFGVPLMKAVGVAAPADVAAISRYRAVADDVLVDAKPPRNAAYPGGHGRPFDWSILERGHPLLDPQRRFMLSGGLNAGNVADAIARTRPWGVDVSSGVESAPGIKDPARIAAFVSAARQAAQATFEWA